jgi:soluble cytochrome b562
LDGSQVRKVVLDKTDEHFLEGRTDAIKKAYKKLTTRDIEITFDKEPLYFTLKR